MDFKDSYTFLTDEDRHNLLQISETLRLLKGDQVSYVCEANHTGLASWGLSSYRQLWLFRIITLTEGICAEWNADRMLAAAVLARSLLETIASFHHVLDHGYMLLQEGELRAFHDRVMKGMFGSRQLHGRFQQMPDAVNALTLVDRLDKMMPGVRKCYDNLCEFSHPNGPGTLIFGESPLKSKKFKIGETSSSLAFVATNILIALLVLHIAKRIFDASESRFMRLIESLEEKYGRTPDDWPPSSSD